MAFKLRPARLGRRDFAHAVGKKAQAPLGRHRRVELAHAARSGVARVDKGFFAFRALGDFFALLGVELFKIGAAQIDFAAHFEHGGRGQNRR